MFKKILTVFISLFISATIFASPNNFTPAQTEQIQTIVHNYLIQNPQILIQVSQALQTQQIQKAQQAAITGTKQNTDKIFNDPNSPVIGNPKSNIVVVEFFDYQCPHCRDIAPVMQNILKNNPNIKIIYKEFPIFGANSQYAASAALAANQQGKYDAVHNALLNAPIPLTKQAVLEAVKNAGVNLTKLKKNMASNIVQNELNQNLQLAEALKLIGTPAIIVANTQTKNYQFMPGAGSEQDLQNLINKVKS